MTVMKGYQETLPAWAKKGTKVVVKRGTMLNSSHPTRKGAYAAKRQQTVVVDHVLSGQTITLGSIYPDGHFAPEVRLKDVAHVARAWGMEEPFKDENATFTFLRARGEVVDDRYASTLKRVVLHTHNPQVCWAGRGGYWVRADINGVHPDLL